MNILVYDVAAQCGGGETVLRAYCAQYAADTANTYYVLLSACCIEETPNLHPLYYKWIKKSWLHRIWFDVFIAPRLVHKYSIDKVISLQNTLFPVSGVKTEVLVHNAVPFCEHRFSLRESKSLWIAQNVIGNVCLHSVKRADRVMVQNEWMRDTCARKTNVPKEKIVVQAPAIPPSTVHFRGAQWNGKTHFFYPASANLFKNHSVILDACQELLDEGITEFDVLFTLTGQENALSEQLMKRANDNALPIIFRGWMSPADVQEYYGKSILLFPSYVETVGLPLLEAAQVGCPIIVADYMYAHFENINYNRATFFSPEKPHSLFRIMMNVI